jgi:hypothetical protein
MNKLLILAGLLAALSAAAGRTGPAPAPVDLAAGPGAPGFGAVRTQAPAGPPVTAAQDEQRLPHSAVVFRRCPLGQRWQQGTCAGRPLRLGWKRAVRSCPPPYRLPTEGELQLLALCFADPRCAAGFGGTRGGCWTSADSRDRQQASVAARANAAATEAPAGDWPRERWVFRSQAKSAFARVRCVRWDLSVRTAVAHQVLDETRLSRLERSDLTWAPMVQVVLDLSAIVKRNAGDCSEMQRRSRAYEVATGAMAGKLTPIFKRWLRALPEPERQRAEKRMKRAFRNLLPTVSSSARAGRRKCQQQTREILGNFAEYAAEGE